MRIAVITPWFPNKRDGWPARFISDSAIALARAGTRVSVNVLRGWAPIGLERYASREHRGHIDRSDFHEIERLQTTRYLTLPSELTRLLTNISLDRTVEAVLTQEISTFRPDAVHVHTELLAPAAVKVATRYKLPVIITIHGENTNKQYTEAPQQALRFRTALSRADRIVVVGEPLRAYAARLAGREDHIVSVWNGVEPPAGQRQAPTPDAEPIELICVANLQEGKGVDLLIDALARLEPTPGSDLAEWRLTLIGDGPLRKELQRQAEAAGLKARVAFAGTMTNAEVFDRLLRADIFALPSYREAFGVAYIEAMASGLLTIGVEGQGPSQFIEHGRTGLLVKPRDVASLETALRSALTDRQRSWRAIAQSGATFARSACVWSAHAEKLLETYRAVASSSSSDVDQYRV
ncbi:glycosyltransferase [Hyphomicrobium zavarzinii]|uniref:glycosyltransferase n=1 Tax=Hyphomicrobium zavarzinii TaxID=48292 RepID=UPI000A039D27|nr:glycosyltransferase [Hyphomicrobium zavarzinii]